MDAVFKALADPTRREILRLLNDGEKTAGQLAERFDISAPSMSHHFNVLKGADLISARRDGQQIYYSLNTTVFQDVMAVMFDLFARDTNGKREPAEVEG
jgi:ArsR family transcriptional regulator, arsenate/arsenite/antimonite-responsive transcriptional repressor